MSLLLNNLKKRQTHIIKKIHSHLKKRNYADSSLNYYCSIEPTPGYSLLQYWDKGIKKLYLCIIIVLKNFISSFYGFTYIMRGKINKNYNHIIISWSKYSNFNQNGSYDDQYFNVNTNFSKKCLWFLIHIDEKIPNKIASNIIIIKKSKNKFDYQKILNFFFNFKKNLLNIKKMIHKYSYQTLIAKKIFDKFKFLLNYNIKNILIVYEGQPFQNLILEKSKSINKKIKTIGFLHNFPPPFPVNLIHRNGSPDKIIVSGSDQKYFLSKFLLWDKNNVIVSQSARFINFRKDMSNKIFLPGHIKSIDFITNKLKYLILVKKYYDVVKFKVQIHPLQLKSKLHLFAKKKIEHLLQNLNVKASTTENNTSIFIGPTGAIGEALGTRHNVIHLTDDPTFNVYSKNLYPSIDVQSIGEGIYKYSLNKTTEIIKFGKKNFTFREYLGY